MWESNWEVRRAYPGIVIMKLRLVNMALCVDGLPVFFTCPLTHCSMTRRRSWLVASRVRVCQESMSAKMGRVEELEAVL